MRSRPTFWILLGLLCVAGAWLFWPPAGNPLAGPNSPPPKKSAGPPPATTTTATASATATNLVTATNSTTAPTNQFAYRLSNTPAPLASLMKDPRAILLANALIDTRRPLNFAIPKQLQSAGDPGAYIVQASGPITAAFRQMLADAGAQVISYVPNNAYLVRIPAGGAGRLTFSPQTASVIPYEPYYKIISPSLLGMAVKEKDLPDGAVLNLGLFADDAAETVAQIEKMGGTILATESMPFGPMVHLAPPKDWAALAVLPGVHIVEPYHVRVRANDLSRAATGVALDSTTNANYLNLNGANVTVQVNDSGIDATHPDLTGRVFGAPAELTDTVGHGTHVAGIIAGDGTESLTVMNASGSVMPATNGQFRGMAPKAKLFAMNFQSSDQELQSSAALTNALISNNSWNYDGDTLYDIEAASYDAATRDAVPLVTGSQPVLFVFSAGNDGGGGDNGVGGKAGSILSPATAKNVISVGAVEQLRDITNAVIDAQGNTNSVWFGETDSSNQVAGFSGRGNTGVDIEGPSGRFKPDVVAPGTFVISTRSGRWDQDDYYYQNPTNADVQTYHNIVIEPGALWENSFPLVPNDAVQVSIRVVANPDSFVPFPQLPILVGLESSPNVYDYETTNNAYVIPPELPTLPAIIADQSLGFNYAVSNNTAQPVNIDVVTTIVTTNATGNYGEVLRNLNDSIGKAPYYYRYESGTSMAAPAVSGTLALIQDYFTNTLHAAPSPALLKAFLLNGARVIGNYNFHETDGRNYQGWGLINLPNSVPTNTVGSNSVFYLEQSPTNALATGDSHTFLITVPTNSASLPLRVTLAWTDPAGNPAAAIKLVNNLDLVVTNTATNTVFYGNDIPPGGIYNEEGNTNAPVLDTVNNVENVFLEPPLAAQYSVTVVGRGVNVNAITAQTNNVVQDYALVVSCGDGLNPGAITVTDAGNATNATGAQLITDVISTNQPLFYQFVGANPPLLDTNTIGAGGNTPYAANAIITQGLTNQWHFYVVTNNGANANFTNAAFITFLPPTLSVPRMGVFAGSGENATTPQADIDLYVAGPADPNAAMLTNLDLTVLSNCVHGVYGDAASLSRGGTEYVVFTNSAIGQVYYVGVKSEVQMASEYAFLPVFTDVPFSNLNPDGSQTVNGIPLPVGIPDGTPAHPGSAYVFGLALYPMEVEKVTVTDQIIHQNIGDLIGTLTHNSQSDVLNNHDSLFDPSGVYDFIYDDSTYPIDMSKPSDGPGSLINFTGEEANGVWELTEVDDSQSQTGAVTGFSLNITPHLDPSKGVQTQLLKPGEFYTTYVDVPLGATDLTIFATNTTDSAVTPVALFVRYNFPPTQSNYDAMTLLVTPTPLGPSGLIAIGQTSTPPLRAGRYFIGLFNPNGNVAQSIDFFAKIDVSPAGPTWLRYSASGPTPLPDDAVTTSAISLTNTDEISALNVGIRVDHPRISDLIFHLISPGGTRYLLMENRGGTSTNGAGTSFLSTNTTAVPHDGNADAYTNVINTGLTNGTITLQYDLFELPDTIDVYYQGINLFHFDPPYTGNDISGTTNITYGPGTSTYVSIIINAGGNTAYTNTAWNYTVTSTLENYHYLTFTEDTNLTTTPIKFAPPPFVPGTTGSSNTLVWANGFEDATPGFYNNPGPGSKYFGGWHVDSGGVGVFTNGEFGYSAYEGTNLLAAGQSGISTNIATVSGQTYLLKFAYAPAPGGVELLGEIPYTQVEVGDAPDFLVTANYTNSPANLDWQIASYQFTATSNSTTLKFVSGWSGGNTIFYGMLLDDVSVYSVPEMTNDLYYFPEQSLDPLVGTRPKGTWQMEVQDNRVGAYDSNSPPVLLDWQLSFVLASTNLLKPPVFTNAPPSSTNMDELTTLIITNGAVAADTNLTLTYALNNSPSWATIDPVTGIITLAPLEGDGPGYYSVTTIVTDDGSPPLSAHNSFVVTVNEVNSAPFWPPGVPSQTNYTVTALSTLSVVNTASDTDIPPNVLTYTLLTAPTAAGALIDTNSGIITWTPTLAQTNLTPYVFETIVTDTNFFALTNQSLSATNYFTVTVVPPSSPTNGQPSTNIVAPGGITWLLVNVPTNADFATNILLFATGPVDLWFSTNSPPTFTNANDFLLLTAATSGSSILGLASAPTNIVSGAVYYLGVRNTSNVPVTNAIEVDFHFRTSMNTAPVFINPNPPTNTIAVLTTFIYTNTAIDTDLPPDTLTYQLVKPPTPVNAVINSATGVITWTPTASQGNTTYTFVTIVKDNGSPQLSATNSFVVVVLVPPYSATLAATAVTGITAQLNGMASPNGSPAVAWFEWGVSSGYGYRTPNVNVGGGKGVVYVTNLLGGLNLPQAYHFRLVTSNAVAVVRGFDQIFDVGGITAWGDTSFGLTNVPAVLTNTAVTVASGGYDNLSLQNTGRPIAWGDNSSTQTNVPASVTNAVAIASGITFNLALRNNGRVVGWGDNSFGQTNVPAGLNNVVAISAGQFHGLALRTNGTVVAWSTLGGGITNVPLNLSNVVAIAAGAVHSLALRNDGTVVAWGINASLQTNVPPGLSNVVAVAGGNNFSLALKSDGTVVAWGDNTYGETSVPAGLSNVVAVAGGNNFSLALKSDGTVVAWGDNTFGQTDVPAGLVNVAAIAGGGYHSLALVSATPVNLINTPPVFLVPNPPAQTINPVDTLVFTNSATDADVPAQTLTYTLTSTVAGTNQPLINTNGIIIWTPGFSQAGTSNVLTTVVTDNGVPPLSATNVFAVIVAGSSSQTNTVPVSDIVYTNIGGAFGFLLKWSAPSNELFQVQWSDNLPFTWQTFTNIVSYNTNYPANGTNATFTFFDDGSQAPFTGSRYYQLILLGSGGGPTGNTPPMLPAQTTRTINPLTTLVVTNTATDADVPAQTLTYTLTSTVTGTNQPVISPTGIITWTPDLSQAGRSSVFTTIVTDDGVPAMNATNGFTVMVIGASQTNTVPISGVLHTNGMFLLKWSAPSNELFQVQWSDSLPFTWQTFTNIVSYDTNYPASGTNATFTFLDDGSQAPFTGSRYYQLILLGSGGGPTGNTPPGLPAQMDRSINPLNPFIVTNTATDADLPAQTLTYTLSSTVIGTNQPVISTNGIITWMPSVTQADTTNSFTTIVTDNGTPNLSATNFFSVIVNPVPFINRTVSTNGGFLLTWLAPTNDVFTLQVATNLASPNAWQTLATNITYTGPETPTNGWFNYLDDGTQVGFGPVRFYRLILAAVAAPANVVTPPVAISSLVSTNGSFLLSWLAPTNDIFTLQVATNFASPVAWQTLATNIAYTGPVTPTNGWFSYLDDGTQIHFGPIRFYRLILAGVAAPTGVVTPPVAISNLVSTNGSFLLTWFAPTNEQFNVRWTTNILPPVTWTLFPGGPVTSTNGTFTFRDTNAPLLMKFYDLILLP